MLEIRQYIDQVGRSPFGLWFDGLDSMAANKIRTALARMEAGNLSNVKGIGGGALEYRIHFGRDGDTLIVLLGGGTKSRQQKDVENARDLWQEYKHRKQQEA